MKKLLTILALTLGLLFGGTVVLAAPASAAGTCNLYTCPPGCDFYTCPPTPEQPPVCNLFGCGPEAGAFMRIAELEQTANDYRAQVVTLTAEVERVQRVADKRAATIQRLRAKIRSLR